MFRAIAASLCLLGAVGAAAAAEPDATLNRYFAIWADNGQITPATVASLYAGRVSYYGHSMTAAEVYRDKLNFIRRWPARRYAVVPGSVAKGCEPSGRTCRIEAVLSWAKQDPRTGAGSKGANTIRLTLVREDGALKIARESGSPVAAAACRVIGGRQTCSAYR